ncbi:hypothetical protein [Mycolicibacterium llatzerense]|uniref:hypothetical protein n=1 Tax=Mycolicibacterium llatzerense TaxID=280871 RepID=UPI0021B5A2CD|nr:hypothetical protein [Mycolicibacterium llatzerense]
MSTYRRATEVAQLAYVLLTEYHRGTALWRALQLDETDQESGDTGLPVFTIWANAAGTDVAGLVASLDAIQLAFDAACVAVAFDQAYPDRDRYGERPSLDVLRDFAFSPIGSLQIYDLYSGSWRSKAAAVFRSGVTRAVVGAVAPLTAVALHIACPALVIPTGITIAVKGAAAAFTVASAIAESRHKTKEERAKADQAERDRIAREEAELARQQAEQERWAAADRAAARQDEQIAQLQEEIQRMRAEREAQNRESGDPVDNEAILDAGAKVTVKVADPAEPT